MADAPARRRRLLLVELVTRERWVFDSRSFPFVQGLARSLGDETRWLCFGGTLTIRKPSPGVVDQFLHLAPEDVGVLARHVEELQPTHVLLSHNLAPDALAVLTARGSGSALLSTSDHRCPPGVTSLRSWIAAAPDLGSRPASAWERRLAAAAERSWSMTRTDWLLRWLGVAPGSSPLFGRYLVGSVEPDYQAVMANEAARRFQPHLLVLGGTACDHRRPVSANPRYAGLDLSDCSQPDGCAFCTWYRGPMSDLSADPVAVALAQLRRVLETTGGRDRCCGAFDLLDARLFPVVDRFLERVVPLGLPPSRFHFEPRIDRALRQAPRLERALRTAAAAGHSIALFRMGAENLVAAENARFNKGLSLAQLDAGLDRLAELSRRFPASFAYDPTLGFITCTPWTTLATLERNVARAIDRGLDPKGIWLYTPLQLFRGAPITRLAERDGLLAPAFADLSLLYEPAVNNASFDSFLPWRFRDDRVGAAFALMVRFAAAALRGTYPDDVFAGDPLYARLLAQTAAPGALDRPDFFAREAVAAARQLAAPVDRERLLDLALARYLAALPGRAPEPAHDAPAAPTPAGRAAAARTNRLRERLASGGSRATAAARGIRVDDVRSVPDDPSTLEVRLLLDGRPYVLYFADAGPARPSFFRTRHHKVTFGDGTPPDSPDDVGRLRRFAEALDAPAAEPRTAPPPARRSERVLLLEFVNADQLPGRVPKYFPLLAGAYRERGAVVRWLRFGLSTTHLLEQQSDAVTLPRDELARLLRAVREFRPTHLLCTDQLPPVQRRRLAALAPGLSFSEGLIHVGAAPLLPGMPEDLPSNLDRPAFEPHYDWEAGNAAATRREIDNVHLVLRQSCGHRRPVTDQPPFAGVADPRVTGHRGCAFCISGCPRTPHPGGDARATPRAWIRKQLAGIARSRGSRLPDSILLESLPSPAILRTCLAELRAAGMEAVRILLGVRTDFAPRVDRILRAHLRRSPASGRFGVYASGLESFVPADLRLFNKGTTPLDNLRAVNIFRRLAAEHGDRFSYYGLSLLLFTPWTTLDGLDLNLGLCRALGLDRREVGNLFQSRLRLHPELPLTALAERQRLLVRREPDPLLRMNRRKLFAGERAWRFADPRLRALCRLVLRFELLGGPHADPLARLLGRAIGRHARLWNGTRDELCLDLARCAIDVLRARRSPPDERVLLERSFALWRERRLPRDRPRRLGPRSVTLAELLDRLADVVARGARGVCAVPGVSQPQLDSVAGGLERRGMHFALVDRRGRPSSRGTLFLARRRETLARRVELQAALADSSGAARRRAVLEAGLLHGFPACCVRAYADGPFAGSQLKGWASFARRAERPGRIPAALHPLFVPEVGFVPCRTDCPAARADYRRVFTLLGAAPRSDRAYVCSLDGTELCELRVLGERDDVLDVEPGTPDAAGPLAVLFRRGRRLHVAPAQLRILAGREPLAVLTASHGLWWWKRCLFPAEWTELARAAAWHRDRSPEQTEPADEGPQPRTRRKPLGGLVCSVEDHAADDARYVFRVARLPPGRACLVRHGPLALWYTHGELTERSRLFARALADVMRRFVRRPLAATGVASWRQALAARLAAPELRRTVRWSVAWLDDCDADPP